MSWRGCKGIEMVSHGSWSDPDLVYEEYTFNYWDIENALWSNFKEDNGITDNGEHEEEFDEYCQKNAINYMEDVINGGYFDDCPNNDWHDMFL